LAVEVGSVRARFADEVKSRAPHPGELPGIDRRGTFRSVKDLTAAIGAFIDACNERCQPFTWTKNADELLAKIRPPKR
jgi:hypothetical protein